MQRHNDHNPRIDAALSEAFKLINQGQLQQAHSILNHILKAAPQHPKALSGMGRLFFHAGQIPKAIECFNQALIATPNQPGVLDFLGRCFRQIRQFDKALTNHKKLVKLEPKSSANYTQLGYTYLEAGLMKDAGIAFKKAEKLSPSVAQYKYNHAAHLMSSGDMVNAHKKFRETLKLSPNFALAYQGIATIKKFTEKEDEDITAMLALLGSDGIMIDDQVNLHFSLGKAYDDLGLYDQAFPHYQQANDLHKSRLDFKRIQSVIDSYAETQKVFTPEIISRQLLDAKQDITPIFIVGMPRSGTSLMEQILSSHRDITGAGELVILPGLIQHFGNHFNAPFPSLMAQIDDSSLQQIATTYISEAKKQMKNATYFTDKMPMNIAYLGFIHKILPQAKIIHMDRNPLDTCVSCFTTNFKMSQDFSYDMEYLVKYYNASKDLIAYWDKLLPEGAIKHINYEKLVEKPEQTIKELLNKLGFDWDDKCLDFYKHKRNVVTASTAQVREPLSTKSVERWRNYEKHLEPLIKGLNLD